MPQKQTTPPSKVFYINPIVHDSPDALLMAIVALRDTVIRCWQERAVTLTKDEQVVLAQEISDMASLFKDLVGQNPQPASELLLYSTETLPIALDQDPALTAENIRAVYSARADQFIVDRIVECVKNADIAAANAWDQIGRILDGSTEQGPDPVSRC